MEGGGSVSPTQTQTQTGGKLKGFAFEPCGDRITVGSGMKRGHLQVLGKWVCLSLKDSRRKGNDGAPSLGRTVHSWVEEHSGKSLCKQQKQKSLISAPTMNYFYADPNNQVIGPISEEQLHALARSGTLPPETQVIQDGSDVWQRYSSIGFALEPVGNAVIISPQVSQRRVDQSIRPAAVSHRCPFCAEEVLPSAKKCKHCGETLDVALRAAEEAKRLHQNQPMVFMNAGGAASSSAAAVSSVGSYGRKSRLVAALCAFFLGTFGIHKFYLGQNGWGLVYLLLCWTGIPTLLGVVESVLYVFTGKHRFTVKYG